MNEEFLNQYHEDHPHNQNLQHLQVGALVGHVPARDTVIGHDDIINLKIALGQAQTVDQFINLI